MPEITYQIAVIEKPINGVYKYRVNRIMKETGKPPVTAEYQLCKTKEEAERVIERLSYERPRI